MRQRGPSSFLSNQESQKTGLLPYIQAAMNLHGHSPVSILSGEAIQYEELLMSFDRTGNNTNRAVLVLLQLELFVFYQDWNAAHSLLTKAGNIRQCTIGSFQSVRFTFIESLICLKAPRPSMSLQGRRKCRRKALKSMNIIKGWAKRGNVNVVRSIWHLLY